METKYLCKFDEHGRRIETLLACEFTEEEKQQKIAEGYIEISEEDWNFYVGNNGQGANGTGYIRDPQTGKPVSAPAYVPTVEEKISALDSQYNADKDALRTAYQDAVIYGDEDLMASLKADLEALDDQYDADYEEIVGEE